MCDLFLFSVTFLLHQISFRFPQLLDFILQGEISLCEGNFNIVFTSNKHPSHWRTNFNEDDALLCALDRIFDDATVFNIKGESFRGKKLEAIALQTSRVKAPASSETPIP